MKKITIVILSFLFLACFNSQKEKNYNFIKGLNEYQKPMKWIKITLFYSMK